MFGNIEIQIESGEIAVLLLLYLIDVKFRKYHSTFRMIGMRKGHKSDGKQVFRANLIRGHLGKTLPGRATGKLDANTVLNGFTARHRYALSRVIAQVIALLEQSQLPLHY